MRIFYYLSVYEKLIELKFKIGSNLLEKARSYRLYLNVIGHNVYYIYIPLLNELSA